MRIGYIGLGKMGLNMVERLHEKGHEVVAYNRSPEPREEAKKIGVETVETLEDLVNALEAPRVIWLMVTHSANDAVLKELTPLLSKGDLIIDGGNSYYEDTIRRGKELEAEGLYFMDVGTSGGPKGARDGACLMIGGNKAMFQTLLSLFEDLASDGSAYAHLGKTGAGHFVKMVHNGIEYGMMQAIAEGFEVLKKSDFNLDLEQVAGLYNKKSVIESRLVGWLMSGFKKFGQDLDDVSGTVAHTGEGEWTVVTAKKLGVPVPIIEESFNLRVK
jgi:6-phosphogluconate dehydrogenase